MYIEKIDASHLIILLERRDLVDFKLEPMQKNMHTITTKRLIQHLTGLAAAREGMDITNKELTMMVHPFDHGCLITVKTEPNVNKPANMADKSGAVPEKMENRNDLHKRKVYKIKTKQDGQKVILWKKHGKSLSKECLVATFNNLENALDAIQQLYKNNFTKGKSSFYRSNNTYYLTITLNEPISDKIVHICKEYNSIAAITFKDSEPPIRPSCDVLYTDAAIEEIGKYL